MSKIPFTLHTARTGVQASNVWSCASIGSAYAKGKCGKKAIKWWLRIHIQNTGSRGVWDVILAQKTLQFSRILMQRSKSQTLLMRDEFNEDEEIWDLEYI